MSLPIYILRRMMMMIPTLLGITIIVFVVINLAPGSPIEQKIQQIRFGGADSSNISSGTSSNDSAVSQEVIDALKKQYGFDKPLHMRYLIWLKNLVTLDFGESFTYEEPVVDVIISKFPISLQFGIFSFLISYLICIPLGVFKAVKHGTKIDLVSSIGLFMMYSIPPFMLGILLIVFFSGGSFFDIFPIGGFVSDSYDELDFWGQVGDRLYHAALPLTRSFCSNTCSIKNCRTFPIIIIEI